MAIRTSIIALLAATATAVSATAQSALETRAIDFLSERWGSEVKTAPTTKSRTTKQTVSATDLDNGITLVNISSSGNRGFVLYGEAGESTTMLGYGLTDTLNTALMPPALAEFIACYQAAGASSKANRLKSVSTQPTPTYPTPTATPVEPFIKTKWGQREPFNNKCPLYEGVRSVTGCDATALGQVLHYYKATGFNNYTIEYADERSQEEVSVNFSRWSFDYDNMLNVYEEGAYTTAQADAVAEMMYIAGAACKMQWSTDESSGQWPLVALDKYFNLKANYYYREALSTDFWMKKIQDNLLAGKPILYGGTGIINSAYSAHIFILDGIDADNYVHINWGWNGESDGYYDITFCHPDFFDDDDDGYYMKQMMICDIEPRTSAEAYKERYVATSSTNISIYDDGTYVSGAVTGVTNNSYEASDYVARLIYRNVDEPDSINIGSNTTGATFPSWGELRWEKVSYNNYNNIPDGKWELRLQTYDESTGTVVNESEIPMRPYIIKKDGCFTGGYLVNEDEVFSETDYQTFKSLSFNAFEPITDVIAKAPFYARVKTKSLLNQAMDYVDITSADLCFTNTKTGKKYVTQSDVALYDLNYSGLDYDGVVKILPPTHPDNGFTMPAGDYLVTVLQSNSDTVDDARVVYPDSIRVTVRDVVDYPILSYDMSGTLMLESWHYNHNYTKTWGESIALEHNAYYDGIVTSNNNYNPVVMMLYAREADNADAEEIMLSAFNFDPVTGFPYYTNNLPGNLYPLEGKYIFYLRYLTPDGVRNMLPERWSFVDKETGLPATPTPHYIQASESANMPMLGVVKFSKADNKIYVNVKNVSANQFSGKVFIQGFESVGGAFVQDSTEVITLAAGETMPLTLEAELSEEATYDIYVKAGTIEMPTLTTKPDGSIAHYLVTGNAVGISTIAADEGQTEILVKDGAVYILNTGTNQTVNVHSIDGRFITATRSGKIDGLSPGVYVLSIGSRSFKVLIK